MAASSRVSTEGGWPKWQIALAVGTPLAVGLALGAYYYSRTGSKSTVEDDTSKDEEKGKKGANVTPDPPPTPKELAQSAKSKGNKYFKAQRYDEAIRYYSEAIDISPPENTQDLSTFHQNRAAAQEQLKNYQQVVHDCTKALEYNPKYVKALFRRAKAYEMTSDKTKCLEDTTAVCILEQFAHQQGMILADKMLKEIGRDKAQKKYQERSPSLPSGQFIRSYFSSFSNDGISSQPDYQDESGEGERTGYSKAAHAFHEGKYKGIVEACTEEITSEGSHLPHALLMRATFLLLMGQATDAKPDLDRLVEMEEADNKLRANALIKRGSMYMQEGNSTDAMDDFATAVRIDPDNPDIYHHRGQLNLLLERVEDAVKDFEKCNTLNPDFALAHAQHCYAQYRLAIYHQSPMNMQKALTNLEQCTVKFPACAEGFALYAQALSDQGQFQHADEHFQKAIAIEPDNPTAHVHRGLLHLAWRKEPDGALDMIKKALEIDTKCDFAYETLGTIEVQRGNLGAAQEYFKQAIELARTEMEMAHLYSLSIAAEAQDKVTQKYNISPPKPFV